MLGLDWMTWLNIATAVVTGASVALKVIAPITKTEVDNKVLAGLEWVLEKLSLNSDTSKE